MKYLWLIFPAITGAMLAHMGYSWISVEGFVLTMCCVIPTVKAMEK